MAEASYQIVITPDAKYAICVFEPCVLPRYVPGFETEAAARQWITDERQKSTTPQPKDNTG